MARRKGGERVLGPYPDVDGHRVIRIDEESKRHSRVFPTLRAAEIYKAELEGELARIDQTTETALEKYKKFLLEEKQNKADSVRQTLWSINLFFTVAHEPRTSTEKMRWTTEPLHLAALTPKRCKQLYDEVKKRPLERTKKPPSGDTQRNALLQLRTFLNWCIAEGLMKGANPTEDIKGTGKRRPRGKSLGMGGIDIRIREARALYRKTLELADEDDQGAIAALVAMLLGMRASEIVGIKVRDIDEDEEPADLLWIPCSKTPAGRRTLEVPAVLRPFLQASAEGKAGDSYLFECEREQDGLGRPHARDWVLDQVHRMCDAASTETMTIPMVTAHAMRGLLATIVIDRTGAAEIAADVLGQDDKRTTTTAYAKPGSVAAGMNRRGLTVIQGGVTVRKKAAGE